LIAQLLSNPLDSLVKIRYNAANQERPNDAALGTFFENATTRNRRSKWTGPGEHALAVAGAW
jgi:hypothetical protein